MLSTGHSRSPQSLSHMQPMLTRTQIPLPAIPHEDIPYQDVPYSPVVGQGALSGVGVFTSLPILEPLNDQFRRASMRRRSSKRYRRSPDRPPAPRMGLRVTPPKSYIPPLDGSPPEGWARPYPSPEGTLNNQSPFFRDNQGFSGSPQDPDAQRPGQGRDQAYDRDSLRTEEPQRLSRPPSYNLIMLSDSPDGQVMQSPPDNRQRPPSGPGGRRSRPPSEEISRPPQVRGGRELPAQPTRAPPPRPVQLPLREALPDVTPEPPLQRQISGKYYFHYRTHFG